MAAQKKVAPARVGVLREIEHRYEGAFESNYPDEDLKSLSEYFDCLNEALLNIADNKRKLGKDTVAAIRNLAKNVKLMESRLLELSVKASEDAAGRSVDIEEKK